jgi:hypothetical protein
MTGMRRTSSYPGDHRRAPVRVRLRIGDDHHHAEAGAVGARREPLVRVDHPVAAVLLGAPAQQRRVGAGHLGLGHPEEGARRAVDERLEEALLLLRRAVQVQDLGVPGVGRLAAEDELRDEAAPDLLVQVGVLEEAAAAPPRLGRQMGRPESGRLRLLAQLRDQLLGRVVLRGELPLVRIHVLFHERAHALAPLGHQVRDDSGHGRER